MCLQATATEEEASQKGREEGAIEPARRRELETERERREKEEPKEEEEKTRRKRE